MSLPHGFSTIEQLEEYLKCIRNLKVGDQIEFYIHYDDDTTVRAGRPSAFFDIATIVAIGVGSSHPLSFNNFKGDDKEFLMPIIVCGSNSLAFDRLSSWSPEIVELTKLGPVFERYCPISQYQIMVKRILKNKK